MPRPRLLITRPPCPFGHQGDTWLDGFYARGTDFERPRFFCLPKRDPRTGQRTPFHPDGRRPHKFIEPLARRHPTPHNPRAGGRRCESCEHVLDRHEGPQTARDHVFTIHEAARTLMAVGRGTSLRWASRTTRREANRMSQILLGVGVPSHHAQLATDYLATFAPVVIDALAPPAYWPDAVVLDAKPIPFTLTTRQPDGTVTSEQETFHLLGVHGYPGGKGTGKPWRVFVAGGCDAIEWGKALASIPGQPSWVICDDDRGIKAAVRKVWPRAVIHTCEGHLQRLLIDRLIADGESPYGDLAVRVPAAIAHPAKWAAFVADASAAGLPITGSWLAKKAPLLTRGFATWQPGRPRSNGAIEHVFDEITKRLWTRRLVFRNQRRLELVVALMLLDLSELADEFRYREEIRKALLRSGGRPPLSRRALDDHGEASIHDRRSGGHLADRGEAGAERQPRPRLIRSQEGGRRQARSSAIGPGDAEEGVIRESALRGILRTEVPSGSLPSLASIRPVMHR